MGFSHVCAVASSWIGRFRFVVAVALAGGWSWLAAAATAEAPPFATGTLPLQMWRLEEQGASPINWGVVVHPATGFVYAANQNGALEFDGVRWRLIPLPRGGPVRSVVVAADGHVWVAGSGQICRLEPDEVGALRAVDVGTRLPEISADATSGPPPPEAALEDLAEVPALDTRLIGNAPQPTVGADGVYFVLPRRIVRFRPDDGVDIWPIRLDAPTPGWWSEGAFHLVLGDRGIYRLGAKGLEQVSSRGNLRVLASAPHPSEGWLWLTPNGPVQVVKGRRTPLVVPETSALFASGRPRCALPLPGGSGAYGTINHGMIVLDAKGRIVQELDRARGLPANRVNGIAADREGGLWLAMHAGLVRVQIGTPLAVHGLAQGISGSPWQVVRLRDRVLVTHSEGVVWRDPADGRFRNIAGISAAMHQLVASGDEALIAGLGFFSVRPDGTSVTLVANQYRYGVAYSRMQKDTLFLYGPGDVQFWRRQHNVAPNAPTWALQGTFAHLSMGAEDLYEDAKGFVWLVTRDGRVRRVDVREAVRADAPVDVYGPAEGLPTMPRLEKIRLLELGQDLLVTSKRGIWRFDPASNRFESETRPTLADLKPQAAVKTTEGAWVYCATPDSRLVHVIVQPDGTHQTTSFPLPELAGIAVQSLYFDEVARTVWISAQGNLLSFNVDWQPLEAPPPLRSMFRRVVASDGKTLWHQRMDGAENEGREPTITLGSAQRAVRVEFTAVSHQADLRGRRFLRFRTRVEGLDQDWTAWTSEPHRDLTNVPDGAMQFEVQARDIQGRESPVAAVAFNVLPPWWRTSLARAIWLALGLGAVTGVVALRTRALHRRAEHLEAVVAARTEELRLQNIELARLHKLEMDEKTSARLAEEKAQLELLRYQLNPHFLLNAFTTLRSLVFTRPESAGEMVGRLASFCRLALTRTDETGATVADEAHLVETYLATEQARWRDDLHCAVEVDPGVRERRLPPFLLQPLVENAVKYGGRTSPDALHVRVNIADDGAGGLRIEVANSGKWVEPARPGAANGDSTHIGLENLHRRLRRYYPEAHHFDVQSTDGWVRILLHLRARTS